MRNQSQIRNQEAQQFIKAQRSRSQSKLYAKDLLKLKKPLFTDYLLHLKMYAGISSKSKHKRNPTAQDNIKSKLSEQKHKQSLQKQFQRIKNRSSVAKKDNIVSHYYCQKNQLMSLKEFIILMEQSKKKSERDAKHHNKIVQKQRAQQLNRNMQNGSTNYVNLRLTSTFAKKYQQKQTLKPQNQNLRLRSTHNGVISTNNLWNNSTLKSNMSRSHTTFKNTPKKYF